MVLVVACAIAVLLICQLRFAALPVLQRLLGARPLSELPPSTNCPSVSVQLATYREHLVLRELIDAVLAIDYPLERLRVQVLDDSTGLDAERTEAVVRDFARKDKPVTYINRNSRAGFKAGALNYGLERVTDDLVAYFDADCRPRPNFLSRTVPFFVDPTVAAVQGRWDFSNASSSSRAQLQAAVFGWLFHFELPMRNKLGLPALYMGSAAVWRRSALQAVGGWQEHPFTAEDLDMTYRAALANWRVVYQPEVVGVTTAVEGVLAFRAQQRRWARSQMQVVADHWRRVLTMPWSRSAKAYDVSTVLTVFAGPVLLVTVLLSSLAVLAGVQRTSVWTLSQWPFSICTLASSPLAALFLAQRSLETRRLQTGLLVRAFPDVLGAMTAYAFGLLDFFSGAGAEFVATPKGGLAGVIAGSPYKWLSNHLLPIGFEVTLAALSLVAAGHALTTYPEAFLPLALIGAGVSLSAVRALSAVASHASQLRARPATAARSHE
jgi:cellulose synthase/poly-beta-1,6-N-acetylglucosamine synthase-like glycosyltransferase